ncbi:hypothetical protein P9112_010701 [Eukaryota sp. TZLM1-RC]
MKNKHLSSALAPIVALIIVGATVFLLMGGKDKVIVQQQRFVALTGQDEYHAYDLERFIHGNFKLGMFYDGQGITYHNAPECLKMYMDADVLSERLIVPKGLNSIGQNIHGHKTCAVYQQQAEDGDFRQWCLSDDGFLLQYCRFNGALTCMTFTEHEVVKKDHSVYSLWSWCNTVNSEAMDIEDGISYEEEVHIEHMLSRKLRR